MCARIQNTHANTLKCFPADKVASESKLVAKTEERSGTAKTEASNC